MPRHHRFLGRFRSSSAPPPRSLVEEAPPPRESPRIAEPRQHFWTRPFRAMMPQPASSDGDSQLREAAPAQSHPETSSSFTRLKAHLPGTGSIAERTSGLTDTVRSVAPGLLPPRPEDDDIITHTFCPDLSPRKRVYGFGICAVVGVGCYFLAFVALSSVAATGFKPFAFLLTIGNVVTLLGTFFHCWTQSTVPHDDETSSHSSIRGFRLGDGFDICSCLFTSLHVTNDYYPGPLRGANGCTSLVLLILHTLRTTAYVEVHRFYTHHGFLSPWAAPILKHGRVGEMFSRSSSVHL